MNILRLEGKSGGVVPTCCIEINERDFPGGTVDKTLHSQCRGPGFDPWSGN